MCKICDNYNFDNVGVEFNEVLKRPTVYFPSQIGNVPADEQFKFCPVCGRALGSKVENPLTFGDLREVLQDHTTIWLEDANGNVADYNELQYISNDFDKRKISLMFPERYPAISEIGITVMLEGGENNEKR